MGRDAGLRRRLPRRDAHVNRQLDVRDRPRDVDHSLPHAREREANVLRRPAFRLGASIYAERPKAFVARLESYWDHTLADGPELTTGGIAELAAEAKKKAKAERKAARSAVALLPAVAN